MYLAISRRHASKQARIYETRARRIPQHSGYGVSGHLLLIRKGGGRTLMVMK